MKITEAYEEWIENKKRLVKRSSLSAYALIGRNQILPYFGNMEVGNIGKKTVQAFVNKQFELGLSKHTIRDQLIVLKMIIQYVAEEYEIAVIDKWNIIYPTSNRDSSANKIERYTPDECQKIVKTVMDNPNSKNLAILIALCTGMRIGEICALQFSDIDMDNKSFCINKTLERIYHIGYGGSKGQTEIIISEPKTKSSRREIPISKSIYPLIKKISAVARPDYFVCSMDDKPVEPRTFRNYYKSFILKKVGLRNCIKFHGLRHTFASTLIENKTDVKTVSSILGHSDVSTTLNIYVHPSDATKRDAINNALKKAFK